MKGMALEFVFQMFLYIVVIMVVIGIIIQFRGTILSALNLCDYVPGGCPQKEECTAIHATETSITESVLRKYCDMCWSKTGAKEYSKNCICYIVSGSFSPDSYELNEYCKIECDKEVTSVILTYDYLLKKVSIEC